MLGHQILALESVAYESMREVLEMHSRGVRFTIDEAAAIAGLVARPPAPSRQPAASGGTIAIVPLMGFMSYRPGLFSLLFGGTSTAQFTAEIRRAGADPSVGTIFIPSDSPGGSVDGVEEASAAVAEAARRKRVVACADVMAASAAYWAISSATEIIASPSGRVGSIGALAIHDSLAKALDQAGIVRTFIASSRYKSEGNEAESLSPEARAEIQRKVDEYDRLMTTRIAAGRHVSVERVRSDYGQGRIVLAQDAMRKGMIDRVATLAETLDRIAAGTTRPGSLSAVADPDLDRRRRRLNLAEMVSRAQTPSGAVDADLERRRRLHRLAEAARR